MTNGPTTPAPLLAVRDLVVGVATPTGSNIVVDRLSFVLDRGETLCIAGESGSGKSMTALALMRLLPEPGARVAGGAAVLNGRDVFTLNETQMRDVRGREIGMIFQEPMTSLNPVLPVGRQLAEAVAAHGAVSGRAAMAEARRLLDLV